MRVPITQKQQDAADLFGEQAEQRFQVRRVWEMRQQAERKAGAGSIKGGPSASPSAARRGHNTSPHLRQGAVRAAARSLPSGPAPSYFGFALALLMLVAAAGVIGVVGVGWVIHRGISRVVGSD